METQTPTAEDNCRGVTLITEVPSTLDLKRDVSDLNICSSMSSSSVTDGTGFCSLENDIDDVSGAIAPNVVIFFARN